MAAAPVGSNGLSLLPSGLLRLLCALWLLALRLLGALRLRLALRLLGALWLRFLCALRLRLVLRLLRRCCGCAFCACCGCAWCCAGWAFPPSALFLLSFLCECRNGGSEK